MLLLLLFRVVYVVVVPLWRDEHDDENLKMFPALFFSFQYVTQKRDCDSDASQKKVLVEKRTLAKNAEGGTSLVVVGTRRRFFSLSKAEEEERERARAQVEISSRVMSFPFKKRNLKKGPDKTTTTTTTTKRSR